MSRAWIGLDERGLPSAEGVSRQLRATASCSFHLSVVARTDSLRGRKHSGAIGSCARLEVDSDERYTATPSHLPRKDANGSYPRGTGEATRFIATASPLLGGGLGRGGSPGSAAPSRC